jgi:hypothetical protein
MDNNTLERSNGRWYTDYGLDTLLVLLFLTVEFGRNVDLWSVDGALMALTMAMLAVLPYFLPMSGMVASFGKWMAVRFAIAVSGMTLGLSLRLWAGGDVTASASSLPMTLLIMAGMVSCYLQFYGLMKLRLAK